MSVSTVKSYFRTKDYHHFNYFLARYKNIYLYSSEQKDDEH
jgi:hypothetical protein